MKLTNEEAKQAEDEGDNASTFEQSSDNDHIGCYFVRNFRLTCHAFESRAADTTEAEAHAKNHQSTTEADPSALGISANMAEPVVPSAAEAGAAVIARAAKAIQQRFSTFMLRTSPKMSQAGGGFYWNQKRTEPGGPLVRHMSQ